MAQAPINLVQISQNDQQQADADISLISEAELAASQEIDNMSISEIIQQRFKKDLKVNKVKTPQ